MKAKILDKTGKEKGQMELPENFSSFVRGDLVLKVFESQKRKVPFGNFEEAGKRHSASGIIRRKRHSWKVSYGKGISRTPRKIMSRDGVSFNWVGAEVANTRGGRRAHPPKSWENQFRKVNKKELNIALNSALAGTINKNLIEKKYNQKIENNLPVVFSSDILAIKTKDFLETLKKVFGNSFEKVLQVKRVRAGNGKARGRKYKRSAGLLFVLGEKEEMKRKGIDVVKANELTIKDLAPNGVPGRFAAFTETAIKEIGEKFR
jgi:large subunit ribosomal protein L4e